MLPFLLRLTFRYEGSLVSDILITRFFSMSRSISFSVFTSNEIMEKRSEQQTVQDKH